jgi:transcriptional antiterminator
MSENVRFEANPEQIKFAEIYLDIDKKLTQKEIAEEIGITDRTIRRWFEDIEFIDWLNSKKNNILNRSLVDRYKTAVRKARQGDFQFSKMLFEMTGDYTQKLNLEDNRPKKIEVEIVDGNTKDTSNKNI